MFTRSPTLTTPLEPMDPRSYNHAAEFCSLVNTPSLLDYLGASEQTSSDELRAKLKKRRKYMQGMQGNPKYKQEALFLIKHFSSLSDALENVDAYIKDVRRNAESEHLPVIEMTIRGVLAAGGLNQEQRDYLQHNAAQLGMSEATFDSLLRQLAIEAGVPITGGLPTPLPALERGATDLYAILGISNRATVAEIEAAYSKRRAMLLPTDAELARKLDIARKVLSNEAARIQYDQTAARTGPPSRRREHLPPKPSTTAPPVQRRVEGPAGGAEPVGESRLEILGDPVRILQTTGRASAQAISIRNGGVGAMPGKAMADVPWLEIQPSVLSAHADQQEIIVSIRPGQVPEGASTAVVTIVTERGERARVVFEIHHTNRTGIVVAAVVLAVLAVAASIGLSLQFL